MSGGAVPGWWVKVEGQVAWRVFYAPRYPFHSAVAKQYADELPLGDHVIVVKEGERGDERRFLASNIVTTYVRPQEK